MPCKLETIEVWKNLRNEIEQKQKTRDRILFSICGVNIAIFAFCLKENISYAALLPIIISVIGYYWILLLQHSGDRIAKYIHDEIENKNEPSWGWETWVKMIREKQKDNPFPFKNIFSSERLKFMIPDFSRTDTLICVIFIILSVVFPLIINLFDLKLALYYFLIYIIIALLIMFIILCLIQYILISPVLLNIANLKKLNIDNSSQQISEKQ